MAAVSAAEIARLLGDWNHTGPLYAGLAEALEAAISDGRLTPGVRLPSERNLADQLAVSRNTVVAAYEQLRSRALVRTRHGSGTVVGAMTSPIPGRREARVARTLLPNGIFEGFLAAEEDAVDMRAAHWVSANELPGELFDLDTPMMRKWVDTHGYFPAGIPPLREALADRLTARGLLTRPDQMIVTSGAQQALALIVQYVIDPGDRAVVEDPTYPGMIETLLAAGAVLDGLPRSSSGVDLGAARMLLARGIPRLVYLIPTAHNPLGTTLQNPERALLVQALREAPLVVEDMTLADTELEPTGALPLAAYAEQHGGPPVATVGSLSKAMWGGLRVGWLRAPEALVGKLTHIKAIQDIGTSVISQVVALRLLEQEEVIAQRRRANMRQRLDALQRALASKLPAWTWEEPRGGLSLWVSLGGVNALDFAAFATRFGVGVAPGSLSSPTASFADRLRIPYGQPVRTLEMGVDRLSTAWEQYVRRIRLRDEVSAVL